MNANIRLLIALLILFPFGLSAQQAASNYGNSLVLGEYTTPPKHPQIVSIGNFSVSHGHCQTPFQAGLTNVRARYHMETLENLAIDFEVDSRTIVALDNPNGEFSTFMKGKDRFDARNHPTMGFVCESTYNLGKDWFQINGKMTIRGVSAPASFHVRPIFYPGDGKRVLQQFILDGEVNLKDFGISGSMVEGEENVPGRIMSMNMVIKADDGC